MRTWRFQYPGVSDPPRRSIDVEAETFDEAIAKLDEKAVVDPSDPPPEWWRMQLVSFSRAFDPEARDERNQ